MLIRTVLLYLCFKLASTGYVAVQLPYANPAGISYTNGQSHAQAGLLAGPTKYQSHYIQDQQLPVHGFQVAASPAVYSYNLPAPAVSIAPHPFYTYNHASVTPVIYGSVQRPSTVAFKPQPIHPVVTHFQPPNIQPAYVPTATTVPIHIPIDAVAHVTPAVPKVPLVPVTPVVPTAHVTPVTTTVTKTITQQHGSGGAIPQTPLPVIRSRKYKVRRPAIQNQFYDIEERVIIRPVGNALIELEQPLSQTETGRPPVDHHYGGHTNGGQGGGHTIITQTTSVTQRPGIPQEHPVYNQQPAYDIPVTQHPYIPNQVPVYNTPVAQPHPVIIHTSNTGQVAHPAVLPQTPIYVNHVQPVYIPTNAVPVTTFKPPHVPVVTSPHPTYIPSTTTESNGLDYDDTIVIDARSGGRTVSPTEEPYHYTATDATAKYRKCDNHTTDVQPKRGDIAITYATEATHQSLSNEFDNKNVRSSTVEPKGFQNPAINTRFANENTGALQNQQSSANYKNNDNLVTDVQSKRGDVAIIYATEATHQSLSNEFDNKNVRSSTIQPESTQNPAINARFGNENTAAPRDQQSSASRNTGYAETTVSSPRVIVANNVSPDQARANQEQFIRLLSERDSISEVSFNPNSGTSSSVIDAYVRGRVLSATPAPPDASGSSRTVNIRRIIVSRPIETEQEVEVREQVRPSQHPGYHTTASPHEVPVYTTARPPAFANDYVD